MRLKKGRKEGGEGKARKLNDEAGGIKRKKIIG
jgi:hypothetical protein